MLMKNLFTVMCMLLATAPMIPSTQAQTQELPYEITFASGNYSTWSVIDRNNDGDNFGARKWAWWSSYSCMAINIVSQTGPADDWLISPPFELEEGTQYEISYRFYAYTSDAKNLPVDLKLVSNGSDPDTSSPIVATYNGGTTNKNDPPETAIFTATSSGVFHIGAHMTSTMGNGYSDGMKGRVCFTKFSITPLQKASAPAACGSLSVTPGANGAETALINFSAPELDSDGNPLAGKVKINLYREDESVPFHTSQELSAGESASYTDNEAYAGETWYIAKAENSSGEGPASRADAWIGVDVPGAVSDLGITRNDMGLVELSWKAPRTSLHNGYIDYSTLRYQVTRILNGQMKNIGTISTTVFTDTSLPDNEQVNVAYQIIPLSSAGLGTGAQCPYFNHGTQLSLPFAESFAGAGYTTAPWRQEVVKNFDDAGYQPEWTLIERAKVTDYVTDDNPEGIEITIASQDTDRGFLCFNSNAVGKAKEAATGRLIFPAIDFTGLQNPVLTFYMFRETYYTTNPATNGGYRDDFVCIEATSDNGSFSPVVPMEFHRYGQENDWVLCEVPLYAMAGQPRVQLAFTGNGFGGGPIYIDNINIIERTAYDLEAIKLSGPARTRIGETATFMLTVKNNGGFECSDYSVDLYKNGERIQSIDGLSVLPARSVALHIDYVAAQGDECESADFSAAIIYAKDQKSENNTSETIKTAITAALLPMVTDLKAMNDEGTVELTWKYPDWLPTETLVEQDGFESYEPFVIDSFGDFTCYDLDKRITFGIGAAAGVTYPNSGEKMAFQVFAPALTNIDENELHLWAAHNGNNMLIAPQASASGNTAPSNDWLVFPRLSGNAQTIKFHARSFSDNYGEFIQGFYATTANPTDADDFLPCPDGGEISYSVPVNWTELSYSVPKGARFFALRHVSADGYALMVDDVTYQRSIPDAKASGLLGYNLYCNGERLNEEPIDADKPAYTHTASAPGEYNYSVTAVYPGGESSHSETAGIVIESTGVDNLTDSAITVSANGRSVYIGGADGLTASLYTPSGVCVESTVCTASTRLEAPLPGIYILCVGNHSFKTILK